MSKIAKPSEVAVTTSKGIVLDVSWKMRALGNILGLVKYLLGKSSF